MSDKYDKADKDNPNKKNIDICVVKSNTLKAQIIWILKSVMNGFSANDQLKVAFAAMFHDAKIASSFSMTRMLQYVVNHGLAPYFKSLLLVISNKITFLLI